MKQSEVFMAAVEIIIADLPKNRAAMPENMRDVEVTLAEGPYFDGADVANGDPAWAIDLLYTGRSVWIRPVDFEGGIIPQELVIFEDRVKFLDRTQDEDNEEGVDMSFRYALAILSLLITQGDLRYGPLCGWGDRIAPHNLRSINFTPTIGELRLLMESAQLRYYLPSRR